MDETKNLFADQLTELHSAETLTIDTLEAIETEVGSPHLRVPLRDALEKAKSRRARIERILDETGMKLTGKRTATWDHILVDGRKGIKQIKDNRTRDAAVVGLCLQATHFSMAGYGIARTYARMLGFTRRADELSSMIGEQARAGEELTRFAETNLLGEAEKV